jgi:hypothetical protein
MSISVSSPSPPRFYFTVVTYRDDDIPSSDVTCRVSMHASEFKKVYSGSLSSSAIAKMCFTREICVYGMRYTELSNFASSFTFTTTAWNDFYAMKRAKKCETFERVSSVDSMASCHTSVTDDDIHSSYTNTARSPSHSIASILSSGSEGEGEVDAATSVMSSSADPLEVLRIYNLMSSMPHNTMMKDMFASELLEGKPSMMLNRADLAQSMKSLQKNPLLEKTILLNINTVSVHDLPKVKSQTAAFLASFPFPTDRVFLSSPLGSPVGSPIKSSRMFGIDHIKRGLQRWSLDFNDVDKDLLELNGSFAPIDNSISNHPPLIRSNSSLLQEVKKLKERIDLLRQSPTAQLLEKSVREGKQVQLPENKLLSDVESITAEPRRFGVKVRSFLRDFSNDYLRNEAVTGRRRSSSIDGVYPAIWDA